MLTDDTYYTNLKPTDPVAQRLINLRDHGAFCRGPLLPDLAETDMYLLDGIDISIKLDLQEMQFIINTAQQ